MHKQEWPNLQRMSSMKTRLINYNLCSYVIIVKRGQHYPPLHLLDYVTFERVLLGSMFEMSTLHQFLSMISLLISGVFMSIFRS